MPRRRPAGLAESRRARRCRECCWAVPWSCWRGAETPVQPCPAPPSPASPDGFTTLTRAYAGARLAVPRNWIVTGQRAPLVVTIQSGTAVVALWRFARRGPVPAGRRALAAARTRLVASIRGRDRRCGCCGPASPASTAPPRSSSTPRSASAACRARSARPTSTSAAPNWCSTSTRRPAAFAAVDRSVFAPVRRSLALIRSGTAMRRAFVVVLDACGVGALPDAADYGDAGTNTLGHLAEHLGGLRLPDAGRGSAWARSSRWQAWSRRPRRSCTAGCIALGPGKDSTAGHRELMGLVASRAARPPTPTAFPTRSWTSCASRQRAGDPPQPPRQRDRRDRELRRAAAPSAAA